MARSGLEPARTTVTALLVRLGRSVHAIPVATIEEVLPALPLTLLPQSSPHVKGVVFVRGHLIPVLDGRRRLGLPENDRAADPHIICLRDGDKLFGIEVDEAIDLIEIPTDEIMPGKELGTTATFLAGVLEHAGQIIHVLDALQLIREK